MTSGGLRLNPLLSFRSYISKYIVKLLGDSDPIPVPVCLISLNVPRL